MSLTDQLERLTAALADRYRIEREIGSGGMATVYLAEDLKHHRQVALKVLRPELSAILGIERFLKEIELTANLQHPHILPLYDSGQADSFLYYVMPYVEDESLRDRLNREQQMGVEETVEIAKAVASALHYAHERGVIHRDIKPENILLQTGQALVADFGIALAISAAGGKRLTETGLSLGTPHYMSPEQATGDRELDARTDVYSLGAVVYEMLVGEPPHIGKSVQAIVAKILSDTPPPIGRTREMVPPNVDAAVHRALAKSPADRFHSAAEFSAALTNPAFTLPTVAAGVGAGLGLRRWRQLGAVAAAVALVTTVLAVWGWSRSAPAPVVSRFQVALPAEEAFVPTWGPSLALSPDGSNLAYIGPSEQGTAVWVKARDALRGRQLPGTDGAMQVSFNPTGEQVGFLTSSPGSGQALKVVSLAGGPPMTLADSGVGGGGPSWGTDGYIYAPAPSGLGLVRIPEGGGAPTSISRNADGEVWHILPQALPNGRGVLFTVFHTVQDFSDTDIAVLDLRTGEHEILLRGAVAWYAETGHLVVVQPDGTLLAAPFDQDALALEGTPISLVDGIAISNMGVFGAADVAISGNGTLVYVAGGPVEETPQLEAVWISRQGAVTAIDPDWRFNSARNEGLALSPDGTRLAIGLNTEAGDDIWIKHLDRGPLSRVTFEAGEDARPRWSADGRSVLYLSRRGEPPSSSVYTRRADGAGEAQPLFSLGEESIWGVSRSDNSEWLALRAGGTDAQAGGRNVLAVRPGTDSTAVPVLTTEYDETAVALSPDGRWLAYASDETGRLEVFVRPFPHTEEGKWQVSSGGGTAPLWAHSGRELFYVTPAGQMMSVVVDTRTTFNAGQPQGLFELRSDYLVTDDGVYATYDISPDDQRFVMLRAVEDQSVTQRSLVMVENWFVELKERVRR